jgi:hypothetical protein
MSFADYLEDEILDHILNDGAYTAPTIFVGVSTVNPGDDASGLAEPSGNGYARVETAAADWNAASGGSKTNANAITFPTASGSWGTLTYVALFDAASSGNLLASGALTASKAIASGQALRFPASSLTVSLG